MQKEYGDESLIYALSLMESENRRVAEIPNDISNGFVVIDDVRIPFSDREILENKLYMAMPSEFEIMPIEQAKIKYPSEDRPNVIFTNADGSMNIGFTFTKDCLGDGETADTRDFLQAFVAKTNPSVTIISSDAVEGEMGIAYFDFISTVPDGEVYNLFFLFTMDRRLVLGTFNCSHFYKARWRDVVAQMLRSVRMV